MIALGLWGGPGSRDAAACLIVEGKIVAAVAEERLNGVKFAPDCWPTLAARACLSIAGLQPGDITALTCPKDMTGVLDWFQAEFQARPLLLRFDRSLCHAASAYHGSGYERALVAVLGHGGNHLFRARSGRLEPIKSDSPPLAEAYSEITRRLGFSPHADEYKVMGLAPYGRARYKLRPLLKGKNIETPERAPGQPLDRAHEDLAHSMQSLLNAELLKLLTAHTEGKEPICLTGALALNCACNGKLVASGRFGPLFVPPASGDDGLAMGAAYLAASGGHFLDHAFLGPELDLDAARTAITAAGLSYDEVSDPTEQAAALLAEGKTLGWVQGRMEWGPRALGNRSILADAGLPEMKARLNAQVKFREDFRPFAPSVLQERAEDYFALRQDSPFMTLAVPVTPKGAETFPATTHTDGTARVQTVENGPFADLIRAFDHRTGRPGLLNTSLNVMGQPLACSPEQALRVFTGSELDALMLGPFLLRKA